MAANNATETHSAHQFDIQRKDFRYFSVRFYLLGIIIRGRGRFVLN